ncbi:MAG: hypothetical protein HY401_02855, partial [Elusimicrobia bacterium]|nr:hypothetical protein [Elusimicrobiota bacterium]
MPPDPRTSPDGSPRVLAGPLSTTGFKGDSPALNPCSAGAKRRRDSYFLKPDERFGHVA